SGAIAWEVELPADLADGRYYARLRSLPGGTAIGETAFLVRENARARDRELGESSFERSLRGELALASSRTARSSPSARSRSASLELEFDPGTIEPGGNARVHVRAPFAGTLLITLEGDRIFDARVVELSSREAVLEIPIPASLRASPYVAASLVRGLSDDELARPGGMRSLSPSRAHGLVPLVLDFTSAELGVTVQVPREVRPGDRVPCLIRVV